MIRSLLMRIAPVFLAIVMIAAWELGVKSTGTPAYILPSPGAVATALTDASLYQALGVTLKITFAALGVAVVSGVVIALLAAQSRIFEAAVFPYLVTLQVTPIVAIAPLIIIWIGDAFTAVLICAAIVAFFPVTANTLQGLRDTDPDLEALFDLYSASAAKKLQLLYIPSALPAFFTGLKISAGLALIGAVVAEFVAGTGGVESGLAYRILEAGYRLDIARMFAALVLLSGAGIALYTLIDRLSRRVLSGWHVSTRDL